MPVSKRIELNYGNVETQMRTIRQRYPNYEWHVTKSGSHMRQPKGCKQYSYRHPHYVAVGRKITRRPTYHETRTKPEAPEYGIDY